MKKDLSDVQYIYISTQFLFWSFPILTAAGWRVGWAEGAGDQGMGASLWLWCRCGSHIVGSWRGGPCIANTSRDELGTGVFICSIVSGKVNPCLTPHGSEAFAV